jgi:hypothetical protein
MSPTEEPTPPDKRDLLAAFDQVVDREREKARTVSEPARRRRNSLAIIALGVISWGWLGYTWLFKPAWLFAPDQSIAQTPAEREATLRFGMYLESERVRDYFDANRRLPMDLGEAGDLEQGVDYSISGDSSFVLTGTLGTATLRLSSDDDVQEFLKPAGMKPAPRGQ